MSDRKGERELFPAHEVSLPHVRTDLFITLTETDTILNQLDRTNAGQDPPLRADTGDRKELGIEKPCKF